MHHTTASQTMYAETKRVVSLKLIVYKMFAFVKRDFIIDSSYQLNFVLTIVNSWIYLLLLFFIGKMIDPTHAGIARYGNDYFSFVLVGFGFYQYFQLALGTYSATIQREQVTGCLEAMLCCQTSTQLSILFTSLYSLLLSFIHLMIIFLLGSLMFGCSLASVNIVATVVLFLLSTILFVGLSIISAAFIVLLKKGDPFGWLLGSMNFILGGAFFPVSIMPKPFETISHFIPMTYSLDALRLSIIKGYSLSMVSHQCIILLCIDAFIFPLSLFIFSKAVEKAKRDGTLVYY